jgi:hypothetical protein
MKPQQSGLLMATLDSGLRRNDENQNITLSKRIRR